MVFCRKQRKKLQKKAPLPGADSPYQGEMSRRDKRGRDAGAKRLRGCCRFAIKPKPQIQFAVWKGRNEHRGKETSLAAARSVVVVSDAPPAAPSFPSCRKRRGRKGALGCGLVRPASEFRQVSMFQASFHTIVTSRASWYAPPDTEEIRFATSCLRTVAVNRRCSRNFDGYYLLAGQVVGAGLCSAPTKRLDKLHSYALICRYPIYRPST